MHGTMVFDFVLSRRKVTLFFEEGATDTAKHPATIVYGPTDPQRRVRYEGALRKGSFEVREGQGKLTWITNHTYTGTVRSPCYVAYLLLAQSRRRTLPGGGARLALAPSEWTDRVLPNPLQFVNDELTGHGEKMFPPTEEVLSEKGEVRAGFCASTGCLSVPCMYVCVLEGGGELREGACPHTTGHWMTAFFRVATPRCNLLLFAKHIAPAAQFVKGVLHGPGERRFRPFNGSSKARKPEIGEFVQGSLVKKGCCGRLCGV